MADFSETSWTLSANSAIPMKTPQPQCLFFFLFEEIYRYIYILYIQCLTSNVSLREYSCIIFHQRIINGLCVCTYDNSNVTTRGSFEYVDDKLQGFLFFSFLTLRPPFFPEKKRYCRLLFYVCCIYFHGNTRLDVT